MSWHKKLMPTTLIAHLFFMGNDKQILLCAVSTATDGLKERNSSIIQQKKYWLALGVERCSWGNVLPAEGASLPPSTLPHTDILHRPHPTIIALSACCLTLQQPLAEPAMPSFMKHFFPLKCMELCRSLLLGVFYWILLLIHNYRHWESL